MSFLSAISRIRFQSVAVAVAVVYSSSLEKVVSKHCLTTVQIELTIARSTIPKENEGPLG